MQDAGMVHGYARVSTDARDLTSQVAQLKAAKCPRIFREEISSAFTAVVLTGKNLLTPRSA
jgi:DNA invertase Pin-like site-specific DNA recombinase